MSNRIKINPAIPLALLITGAVETGIAFHLNKEKLTTGDLVPHEIGHEDINPYFNFNVKSTDFVLLDAGSSKNLATILFDQKIKYCNEKGIACGLIINSTAEKEYDIYNDVEYVKSILSKYDVKCPVYLNIKNIMKNNKLNNTEKQNLINIFLEMCKQNGIYVGIYGEDNLVNEAKKYLDIKDSDVYIIKDDKEDYEGNFEIYKDEEGKIHAKKDIVKYIEENRLNDLSNFKINKKITIKSIEELEEISFKYNLSIETILKYNNLLKISLTHKFHKGESVTLKIPCIVENIPYSKTSFVTLEEPLMGCDLSEMQGNNTDWDNMDFDFIILRSNHGVTKDECFEYNAKNCIENNISIGAYCVNEVLKKENESKEDFIKRFKEQVEKTLETIKKFQIDYPVYLDLESKIEEIYLEDCLSIWEKEISENGYIPGIYSNQSVMGKIIEKDNTINERFELWIAGGENYNEEVDIANVKPNFDEIDDFSTPMIQSTSSCINAPAKNSNGYLDIDFTTRNYTKPNEDDDLRKYEIKSFPKTSSKIPYCAGGVFLIGAATIGMGKVIKKKRKTRRR